MQRDGVETKFREIENEVQALERGRYESSYRRQPDPAGNEKAHYRYEFADARTQQRATWSNAVVRLAAKQQQAAGSRQHERLVSFIYYYLDFYKILY